MLFYNSHFFLSHNTHTQIQTVLSIVTLCLQFILGVSGFCNVFHISYQLLILHKYPLWTLHLTQIMHLKMPCIYHPQPQIQGSACLSPELKGYLFLLFIYPYSITIIPQHPWETDPRIPFGYQNPRMHTSFLIIDISRLILFILMLLKTLAICMFIIVEQLGTAGSNLPFCSSSRCFLFLLVILWK